MSRDTNFEIRIYDQTGRGIQLDEIQCVGCNGVGFNAWEEDCEACDGRGTVVEYVFADSICDHEVPMCDCPTDFQLGDKGFVFVNEPESVEPLWYDEWEAHRVKQLSRIMAKTDHIQVWDRTAA